MRSSGRSSTSFRATSTCGRPSARTRAIWASMRTRWRGAYARTAEEVEPPPPPAKLGPVERMIAASRIRDNQRFLLVAAASILLILLAFGLLSRGESASAEGGDPRGHVVTGPDRPHDQGRGRCPERRRGRIRCGRRRGVVRTATGGDDHARGPGATHVHGRRMRASSRSASTGRPRPKVFPDRRTRIASGWATEGQSSSNG